MVRSWPLEERFWAKVEKGGVPGGCWEWRGSRDGCGYGTIGEGPGRRSDRLATT